MRDDGPCRSLSTLALAEIPKYCTQITLSQPTSLGQRTEKKRKEELFTYLDVLQRPTHLRLDSPARNRPTPWDIWSCHTPSQPQPHMPDQPIPSTTYQKRCNQKPLKTKVAESSPGRVNMLQRHSSTHRRSTRSQKRAQSDRFGGA